MLAVLLVIGVGQLWSQGWLLPEDGALRLLAASVNQLLIFSPMGLLLLWRRQRLSTAWLPLDRVPVRVGLGVVLATLAIVAFHFVRGADDVGLIGRWAATWSPRGVDKLVQVFLEDAAIAILLCRLGSALRRPTLAVVAVGVLFAAAHIPAMLSKGAEASEFARLVLDAGLAVVVLGTLQRSRDIWWFFPVHFAMDMTQFA